MFKKLHNILFGVLLFIMTSGILYAQEARIAVRSEHFEHQIGHLLIMYAMFVLLVTIKKTVGTQVAGWKNLYNATVCFFLWNVLEFVTHAFEWNIPASAYSGTSYWSTTLLMNDQYLMRLLYYILDILVPVVIIIGFIYLYRSVKAFVKISL